VQCLDYALRNSIRHGIWGGLDGEERACAPPPGTQAGRRVAANQEEEIGMHAEVGDEIVVRGRHVGDENRKGMIIEVHGEGGAPPYLVRWANGHDSVFTPSSDTVVEHHPAQGTTG